MSREDQTRRVTMTDVAKHVGVSQQLVSLVFRGQPGASEEMRQRVLQAADRLGYVRDESARSLRSHRPTSIGVAFRTHQPFHDELLDGLYAATSGGPHNLVLSAVSEVREEQTAIQDLIAHRCGALILLGPRMDDDAIHRLARGVPVVVVARSSSRADVDWVTSEDGHGLGMLLDHLTGLGHRDIVFLSAPHEAGALARAEAFREQCEARGLAMARIEEGGVAEEAGARAVERMIEQPRLPTAIIGFNDRCALGATEVLLRGGIRIPGDVSVAGFDDSGIASRSSVDMTSVRQDVQALSTFAASRAMARLTGDAEGQGLEVPTQLVCRSSTGPAAC